MEAHCSSELGNDDLGEMPLRERLSHMSLEELKQLKEKLGTKIFDEAMFGSQNTKKPSVSRMSREHFEELESHGRHNMPLEMSSKVPSRRVLPVVKPIKKPLSIDPRFDPLYGDFNAKIFAKKYNFIEKKKKVELITLKKKLGTVEGEEWKKHDFVIKKMENELREANRLREKRKEEETRHENMKKALKHGRKPVYFNKSDLRAIELVKKFESMKQKDKVERSIAKQRQKNATKSRKKVDVLGLGND